MLQEVITRSEGKNCIAQLRQVLSEAQGDKLVVLNSVDAFGDTAIHLAAQDGYADVVEFLLDQGANPDLPDNMRNTPLHLAALYGHYQVVWLLHRAGADLNASNDLGSVLHWALEHYHADIVDYLLQHGADVRSTDKYGNTPLHMAAKTSKCPLGTIEVLIQQGASLTARNRVRPLWQIFSL